MPPMDSATFISRSALESFFPADSGRLWASRQWLTSRKTRCFDLKVSLSTYADDILTNRKPRG